MHLRVFSTALSVVRGADARSAVLRRLGRRRHAEWRTHRAALGWPGEVVPHPSRHLEHQLGVPRLRDDVPSAPPTGRATSRCSQWRPSVSRGTTPTTRFPRWPDTASIVTRSTSRPQASASGSDSVGCTTSTGPTRRSLRTADPRAARGGRVERKRSAVTPSWSLTPVQGRDERSDVVPPAPARAAAVARRGLPGIIEASLVPSAFFLIVAGAAAATIAMLAVLVWGSTNVLRSLPDRSGFPHLHGPFSFEPERRCRGKSPD